MTELAGLGWADTEAAFDAERAFWDRRKHPRRPSGGEGGGEFAALPAGGPAPFTGKVSPDRLKVTDRRAGGRNKPSVSTEDGNKIGWLENNGGKWDAIYKTTTTGVGTDDEAMQGVPVAQGKTSQREAVQALADYHNEHAPRSGQYADLRGQAGVTGAAPDAPASVRAADDEKRASELRHAASSLRIELDAGLYHAVGPINQPRPELRPIDTVVSLAADALEKGDYKTALTQLRYARADIDKAIADGVLAKPEGKIIGWRKPDFLSEVIAGLDDQIAHLEQVAKQHVPDYPEIAGLEAAAGIGRAWWNPRLHPRKPHSGEFATKAAGDIEALGKELHEDEMAEAMLAGVFKLDSKSAYHKVHHHLRAAAKALRDGDAETARHHLAKAKEYLLKLPGKPASKHAPRIDKRLADVGKMLTDTGKGKPPKPRVPVLSPQQMMMGSLMAAGAQRFDPRQPRGPGGKWIKVAGHLDALASNISHRPAAAEVRKSASSLRHGDREGAIRHLTDARRHLDGVTGPDAAAARRETDRHLGDLMPASLTNKELRQMAAHIPPMMNEPATHAGLAAFGAGGDAAALIHAMGAPPYHWTGGVTRWSRDGLAERLAVYRLEWREELHHRAPKGGEHGGQFAHAPGTAVQGKAGPRFGALDSISANTRPDGTFTPARQALHDRLVAQALAGHTASERPVATFLGGGPASGKSTVTRGQAPGALVIDPDALMAQLPEYQQMTAAHDLGASTFSHSEARMIADQARAEAQRRQYDYMMDGTGDTSVAGVQGMIDAAHAAGYQVAGKYVTTDTETAVARARARAEETGRMVPETVIRKIHGRISEIFPQLLGPGGLDSAELWDNNGAKPVLIGRKTPDGRWQVKDEAAWRRFLAKA